jgi:VIT1/CCC1 family predicted Fe2+/Mn2+ transporter
VIPVVLFELSIAILVSVVWGLGILAILSYKIAMSQGKNPRRVIAEHLLIAIAVIIITHFVGDWISVTFE